MHKSQVHDRVIVTFAPTAQDPRPPELATVLCCVAALQEDLEFTMLDDESDEIPEWLYALPSTTYCSWDGSAEGSFGYGGVAMVNTSQGAGLRVHAGGSSMSGASGFWILPTKAVWVSGL